MERRQRRGWQAAKRAAGTTGTTGTKTTGTEGTPRHKYSLEDCQLQVATLLSEQDTWLMEKKHLQQQVSILQQERKELEKLRQEGAEGQNSMLKKFNQEYQELKRQNELKDGVIKRQEGEATGTDQQVELAKKRILQQCTVLTQLQQSSSSSLLGLNSKPVQPVQPVQPAQAAQAAASKVVTPTPTILIYPSVFPHLEE